MAPFFLFVLLLAGLLAGRGLEPAPVAQQRPAGRLPNSDASDLSV